MPGGRKETVSDSEILELFRESSDPVLSTAEIAEALEFTKSGARKRLYDLVDDGYIESKKIGNSPAYWLTPDGDEFVSKVQDSDE